MYMSEKKIKQTKCTHTMQSSELWEIIASVPDLPSSGDLEPRLGKKHVHVLMGDEKEGRKKQARSNKQQGKATQHTQGSHFS